MTSAGGLVPAGEAADLPVALLLSGPAGGVRGRRGGRRRRPGSPTPSPSTWAAPAPTCASSRAACPSRRRARAAAGFPVRLPSPRHPHHRRRRRLDRPHRPRRRPGGRAPRARAPTRARPATAGAGTAPTVTDADLVLGRIPADAAFPGLGRARRRRRPALRSTGAGVDAPSGVVAWSTPAMERAVRAVTVERGVDPPAWRWWPSAGAGPLHACALAEALGMAAVVVPPRAGVLSAVGPAVLAPPARPGAVVADARRPRRPRAEALADARPTRPRPAGRRRTPRSTTVGRLPLRGQSHELTVADGRRLPRRARRRNGYARPGAPVEVVALRARARRAAAARPSTTCRAAVDRRPVRGPAVVAEPDCTIWIPDGWTAEPGARRRAACSPSAG